MILIGVLASLFVYFGDGPFWPYVDPTGTLYDACKHHWWANLLYINNIVYPAQQVGCVVVPLYAWLPCGAIFSVLCLN